MPWTMTGKAVPEDSRLPVSQCGDTAPAAGHNQERMAGRTDMKASTRLHERNELKINIESMVRCGGSCIGCILSADERVHGSVWPQETFDRVRPFVVAFLRHHLRSEIDFTEISVAFGQGDHLLLSPEEAERIVRWTASLMPGRVNGFITASVIGRRERVARSVEAWHSAMVRHSQSLNVDLVFDPVKVGIERFAETYAANIACVRDAFGDFDLNINVGPDTPRAASPEQIQAFVLENGFSRLTLNLVPLPAKGGAFAERWSEILSWLSRTMKIWRAEYGYDINFCPTIAPYIEGLDDRLIEAGMPEVVSFVEERLAREIYIDGEGYVSHTQAGFGDVPLGRRMGFPTRLTVDVPEDEVPKHVATSARALGARIAAMFLSTRACAGCGYQAVCPKIGTIALANSLRGYLPNEGCPAGVKPLLDDIQAFMKAGHDLTCPCYRLPQVHVPRGFDPALLPHAKQVQGGSGPLSLEGFRS